MNYPYLLTMNRFRLPNNDLIILDDRLVLVNHNYKGDYLRFTPNNGFFKKHGYRLSTIALGLAMIAYCIIDEASRSSLILFIISTLGFITVLFEQWNYSNTKVLFKKDIQSIEMSFPQLKWMGVKAKVFFTDERGRSRVRILQLPGLLDYGSENKNHVIDALEAL